MMREAIPITTAWIYHNADLWLISLSSDGNSWITIADKNLWATAVWNNWDALSANNCWNRYQRWNNYWFPYSWTITSSTTRVDVTNYWPWNYYSSSTFIKATYNPYCWDTTNNANLRWWVTWTNEAMQWPCNTWYHIPNTTEWGDVISVWVSLWLWTSSWRASNLRKYLLLPLAWYRSYSNGDVFAGEWIYWTSNRHTEWNSYCLWFDNSTLDTPNSRYMATWWHIRPFKNEALQPDETRTVLYQ